ncbi:ABC transporter permease subunit [Kutzneria sp. 744]|uniref:ABC transporter permease n=1 Tax=Kutzneria sp. (strain 744) TaxID=345341 RepID=UPI0003EECE00|nr:ABC transporter permease subunit [Kutzneria sp. 744]EWM11175.1 ABC transporter permease component [Kutzneria sp. 744]
MKFRNRQRLDVLGLLPFLAYVVVFLGVPTVSVVVGAFQDDTGGWTLSNIGAAAGDPYLHAFVVSTEISALTAVIGALVGLAIAFAVSASPPGGVLRQVVSTASGVLAYFAGVPLAFAFIAAIGSQGLVTRWLGALGLDISGFSLFGFAGITVVYLYFQIPLMVLVIFPALEGLRPQWQEAASNLGASRWQYWRLVGGPLLLPPFLGALMLLFANSFAAYATAAALTNGIIPLVPIQIAAVMSGNVAVGQENLGNALGLGMILIVGLALAGYAWMQRRTSRWLR